MDLMGLTRITSLGGRKYILVVVDDYSQFTWAILLQEKSDAIDTAQQLFKRIQIERNYPI
jgi:DNA-binding transcriptional regulator GbsR (MarR family)